MYCVRIWNDKTQKWSGLVMKGGYVPEFDIDTVHTIAVTVDSSNLLLSIDGVQLGTASLPFPIIGSQIGLFCQSAGDIADFPNLRIEAQKPRIFVVMPFSSEPYDDLYRHVFQPLCRRCELDVHRSDKTYGPGLIITDIVQKIMQSANHSSRNHAKTCEPQCLFRSWLRDGNAEAACFDRRSECSRTSPLLIFLHSALCSTRTLLLGKSNIEMELASHLNAILPAYTPVARVLSELRTSPTIA